MIGRATLLLMVTVFALGLADAALACAVCSGGDSQAVRDTYVGATLFMSLLPLCVIAGGVLALRRFLRTPPEDPS